jgi:flagellar hook-associated protein 3
MRVTQAEVFQTQLTQLRRAFQRVFAADETLVTGLRINRPSDDPAAMLPLMGLKQTRAHLGQVQKNLNRVTADLNTVDLTLQDMSGLLTQAMTVATEGASGTPNQADRDGFAIEVQGILDQLLALANSRGISGFLFGGTQATTLPFERTGNGAAETVLYRGDEHVISVDLGESLRLRSNFPGSQLFVSEGRQPSVYSGTTGAAAGSGSDSATGSVSMQVTHTRTILGGGGFAGDGDPLSQLQLGASSAGGDSVLGPPGSYSINLVDTSGTGTTGTVSINGGPAIPWTSADTDLLVTTASGEGVHLDLSNIVAGFNGNVSVEAQGEVSLDGGLTTSAIDFTAANQLVQSSTTGGSVFVNSTGIVRTGSESLRFPGTYDAFASLIELRNQLQNVEGLAPEEQRERVRAMLEELEVAQERILTVLADVGARQRLAQAADARAAELDLVFASNQAELEEVDFAAASAELFQAETVLQATLMVNTRSLQRPSLLDFF